MSKLQEPFRYDYVGSFLRTEELKKATTQYNENKITKEVYDNIVNEEIAKLVAKQKELVRWRISFFRRHLSGRKDQSEKASICRIFQIFKTV